MSFILKSNDNTCSRPSLVSPAGQKLPNVNDGVNGVGPQKILLRLGSLGQPKVDSPVTIRNEQPPVQTPTPEPEPVLEDHSMDVDETTNELSELPESNPSSTLWEGTEATDPPVTPVSDNISSSNAVTVAEYPSVEPARPKFVFEKIQKVKEELIEIDDDPSPRRRLRSSIEPLSVTSESSNMPTPSFTRPLRSKPKPTKSNFQASAASAVPTPVVKVRSAFQPEKKYDSKIGHYFCCPQCDQKYVSVDCVQEHLSANCSNAGGKAESPSNARSNSSIVSESMNDAAVAATFKFQCTYPGCTWLKRYRTAEDLVRFHINTKHAVIPAKKKKCLHCGELSANLTRHIRMVHREECTPEAQDKDFRPTADDRRRRIPNRTSAIQTRVARRGRPFGSRNRSVGEKSQKTGSTGGAGSVGSSGTCILEYKCAVCPQAFSSMLELDQHSVEHRIEIDKPFKCTFCEKSFFLRTYLDEHLKSHVQEFPYTCKECEQCFNRESDYQEHLKKHAEGGIQKDVLVEVVLES